MIRVPVGEVFSRWLCRGVGWRFAVSLRGQSAALDTSLGRWQCLEPIDRDALTAIDTVSVRPVGEPAYRFLDLRQALCGLLGKHHGLSGIDIWARFFIEQVAEISTAERFGGLLAKRVQHASHRVPAG